MTLTTLPTSRIVTQDWNQDFAWLNGRHYPNGFYASIGWKGHNGIDYGCWEGDPVEAVCDGVIEFAGDGNTHYLLTGGGNAVLLRNDALGVMFEYLHLSRFEVKRGQQVKRGQVIARSGNSGTSSGPHLHLGAIPIKGINVHNGYRGRIDPTPYLYGPMNPDYAGITTHSTTTASEEDELAFTIDQLLNHAAYDGGPSLSQVLKNLDDSEVTRYVKGDKSDTLYDMTDDGKLRPIILAEWQATGRPYRTLPQVIINALPKTQ